MEHQPVRIETNGHRVINISAALLLTIVFNVIVTAVAWGRNSERQDVMASQISQLQTQREMDRSTIEELERQLVRQTQALEDFHRDYERDANKYIRDPKDRR